MSEDVEPSPAKPPRVEALYDGREVTVIVDGNLDLTSSLRFQYASTRRSACARDRSLSTPAA